MAIVSRTAMAAMATVGAAVGAEGVRGVAAMTGRETPETADLMDGLTDGLTADLMVAHGAAPVAVATAILTQHVTTLKPVSLRGDAAKSATGDRSGAISCACMCATI